MTSPPLLSIRNLRVTASRRATPILEEINLDVASGEVVALIGESGSGKTTLSLTALGLLRDGLMATGTVVVNGTDMLSAPDKVVRMMRGKDVAYVAQSAAASFNPALSIGWQVTEPSRIHDTRSGGLAREEAERLYRELGLPNGNKLAQRYPHQVSGGQLQRFMAAMALLEGPGLIVFDEPTTALDVTTQVGVLLAFKTALAHHRMAAIYVSHDLAVVAQMADRIVVMRNGRIVEEGPTQQVLDAPKAKYTAQLLAARQSWGSRGKPSADQVTAQVNPPSESVLNVERLVVGYGYGKTTQLIAVNDFNLKLSRGRIAAIVGESGSGKSTAAQAMVGLLAPVGGTVTLNGVPLAGLSGQRSSEQRRKIQLVFQMADTALNPSQTVEQILGRALRFFHKLSRDRCDKRISELLDWVQLPQTHRSRLSRNLSGGEKQRVNLARALAADPEVLICDEITSALDTIVADAIVALVRRLRTELNLAIVFISHNLETVAALADDIVVMKRGQVVESGNARNVLLSPTHEYTIDLVNSVPSLRPGWLEDAAKSRLSKTDAIT